MVSKNATPLYVFGFLGLIWGTNFLFMKDAVSVISPLQVVFLRVVFGSLPIIAFGLYKKALSLKDLRKSQHFVAMALLANVIPYYGFVKGTQYLASGIAGVISGTIPLITAVMVTLLLPEERMTRKKTAGLVFGFTGVVLIANLKSGGGNSECLGAGFITLGALSYAAAMVYAKKFVGPLKMSSIQLTSYQTFFSALILAILTPFDGMESILENTRALMGLILGLGLFGTGFAFVMYYYIIEKLGTVMASSVYYIPPVVALAIGALVNGEAISLSQGAGALLIIFGIYLARSGGQNVIRKS